MGNHQHVQLVSDQSRLERPTPRAADSPEHGQFCALGCGILLSHLGAAVLAHQRAADAGRWAAIG